jgi:hypothetical protein
MQLIKRLKQYDSTITEKTSNISVAPVEEAEACTDRYVVGSTGAVLTNASAVSLLNRYVSSLQGDMYYSPIPIFEFIEQVE